MSATAAMTTTRRMTDVADLLRAELADVRRQMAAIQADAKARIWHLVELEREQIA
jgi:hypothetical protein